MTYKKNPTGKLTRKDQAMLDEIVRNPTISNTEAYIRTHETNNRDTARAEAVRVLAKPSSQIYLKKHLDRARDRIIELVESQNESIALKASQDILNREKGLPASKSINANINIEKLLNELE